ncbi:MAG TPA: hypothetical protein PLG76_02225 [Candidatus Paceibacterota bacterium]|nr:hypothetical protein [Candidatus Paceibacterota bacterium]
MSEQEDKLKSLEILVSATRDKVDYQLNADNGLDSKAGVMIALEMAIVIFYIQSIHHLCSLLFIPIIIFGFSIYVLWNVLNVKTYNTGVVDFYNDPKNYRSMKSEILLEQLLSDYQNAFDKNSRNLEDKNKNYKKALNLFLIGFVLLIFFI